MSGGRDLIGWAVLVVAAVGWVVVLVVVRRRRKPRTPPPTQIELRPATSPGSTWRGCSATSARAGPDVCGCHVDEPIAGLLMALAESAQRCSAKVLS